MKTQLIVSIISDQTFPNVQFIKEMKHLNGDVFDFLFITTETMKERGYFSWIEKAAEIKGSKEVIVERKFENSINPIVQKLVNENLAQYTTVLVNITGGTKLITLAVNKYFSVLPNAEIYYVDRAYQYFKLGKQDEVKPFTYSDKLDDYLFAYGFEYKKSAHSGNSKEITENVFNKFNEGLFIKNRETLIELQGLRDRNGKQFDVSAKMNSFLYEINFEIKNLFKISKSEVKYLTGEWFEEYIGQQVKDALKLRDDQIFIGVELKKELSKTKPEKNSVTDLLGETKEVKSKNEFDVMFINKGTLYVIECKTSIIGKDGKTFLGETIYKADSLKTKLGLYARSYILTLTDLKEYVNLDNNKRSNLTQLINRANLSDITIKDKSQLVDNSITGILSLL